MTLSLNAELRNIIGKQVEGLRKQGLIPAVIYGKDVQSQNLTVEYLPFGRLYREGGESTLIDLKIGERAPVKVLVQDVQIDPVTGKFVHVDFRQVKMTEKIKAEALLKFIGEAPAVKELGGTLIKNLDKIEIECLPQDLVHEIKVDVISLRTFEDAIHVKDLKIPDGVEVLVDLDATVATVEAPLTEEEFKELEAKPEEKVEAVEVVEKEKKEEGAPVEEKKE